MNSRKILSAILALLMLLPMCITGITAAEADLPFTDVKKNWSYEPIKYVYETGLMNGTGDGTTFSPNMNLSRGMVVTVLYRNDGSPETKFTGAFVDVQNEKKYYATAAEWAYKNGIVTGTGENEWGEPYFSPDRDITRGELATMFARYAAYKHVDTEANTAAIDSFPDSSKVAKWATAAVKWAVGTGLITGKGNGDSALLAPTDKASRAEFATVIKRYNEKDDAREFTYKLAYTAPIPVSKFTEKDYPLVNDADIYVSVDGDDRNPGTVDKPLATFEGAKAKVREIKDGKTGEIKVAFKAGNYGVLDNVTFTPEDSGRDDLTIVYCAYGDGDVVFQNGILLPGKDFVPADESDYHLLGSVDTSKVYKIDLTGKIDSFSDKNIMFSETGMCHEARIPNKVEGTREQAYYNVTTTHNERESILLQSYLPGIVSSFRTIEGMKVTGMLRTGWLVDTFKVKSFDKDTGVLTFDFDDPHAFDNGYTLDDFVLAYEGRMDDYVFFHNLSDQIDAEGEYWFDNSTMTLYMYAPEGNYYLSTAGTFITMVEDTEHISFAGLDFIATTDDAIDMDANHVTFDSCTIGNVAGSACIMTEWGYRVNNITVKNCEFYNFYDKGVSIFGSWPALADITPSNIVITNNYFHDFSSPQTFGAGVNLTNTVGTVISHNEFVNGAHAGISFGSCIDTVMEYNVLDNMMSSTIDYGAIYNFNTILHRGNIIRYNIIKNIRVAGGCYGVYIDGSFAQEVYGNVFFNAGDRDIVSNGGRENVIHDNISIRTEGKYGDFMLYNFGCSSIDENGELTIDENMYNATVAEINQKPAVDSANYEKWYERWPILYEYSYDIKDIDKYECIYRTVNTVRDNKLFGTKWEKGDAFDAYGEGGNNTEYSLNENPIFTDPTHGNYTILPEKGFDLPYEIIGRY